MLIRISAVWCGVHGAPKLCAGLVLPSIPTSPHFSHPVYCIGVMLRRAVPTALRDPQAGAPGLLNVPYSTFAGASVARGATHSNRSFRRFATTWCEKSGLGGHFYFPA